MAAKKKRKKGEHKREQEMSKTICSHVVSFVVRFIRRGWTQIKLTFNPMEKGQTAKKKKEKEKGNEWHGRWEHCDKNPPKGQIFFPDFLFLFFYSNLIE